MPVTLLVEFKQDFGALVPGCQAVYIIFQFELLSINIKIRVVSISSYLELEDY